jgi:multiple sugar transport system substrate-binding protein
MGVLMDLTELVDKEIGVKKFVPATWLTSGIEGRITAIPWFIDARAVFYRKGIFDKLGLTTKNLDTWEEFEKTLQKLQDAYIVSDEKGNIYLGEEAKKLESQKGYFRVYPIGVPGKNDWNVVYNFNPWIWAAGGDWLTPDKKML